jgi:hypothetical protein
MDTNNSQPAETPKPIVPQPEEEIAVAMAGETRENLTVRKAFRLTPSADAELRKWQNVAYFAGKNGLLGDRMKENTLQAYVNFSFDCAQMYLTELSKQAK